MDLGFIALSLMTMVCTTLNQWSRWSGGSHL